MDSSSFLIFFSQLHTADSGILPACATEAMLEPGSNALQEIESFSVFACLFYFPMA